jgi:hypothetical protein
VNCIHRHQETIIRNKGRPKSRLPVGLEVMNKISLLTTLGIFLGAWNNIPSIRHSIFHRGALLRYDNSGFQKAKMEFGLRAASPSGSTGRKE